MIVEEQFQSVMWHNKVRMTFGGGLTRIYTTGLEDHVIQSIMLESADAREVARIIQRQFPEPRPLWAVYLGASLVLNLVLLIALVAAH